MSWHPVPHKGASGQGGRGERADEGSANLKVGVVEAVDNIPAELQELLALQQYGVEEAEREQQLLVLGGLGAVRELDLRHQLVQC